LPGWRTAAVQKPNSWTYNFLVEVSGHNFESSQTWGFYLYFLNYREGVWFLAGFPLFLFTVYSNRTVKNC
jgi:hypothetical protein